MCKICKYFYCRNNAVAAFMYRTKYIGGHTDVCAGVATASTWEQWEKLTMTKRTFGGILVGQTVYSYAETCIDHNVLINCEIRKCDGYCRPIVRLSFMLMYY